MARVSKSNVFALDTSSILNQLTEIEQRAKAADAALINMGSGKKSKPNIAAYAEFADVLQTVTETINLLQGAMDGQLKTKSLKDATTLLDNMGVSAHEFVQIMSELTKFKITDVIDEKEALASMRSIGDRLTKLFGNKEFFKGKDFGFKLDMEVFDKKDIMAQYQALMKAVAPTIQHMSRMIADAGWEQLALDNKFAVTQDVIKEGMEDIVAEVDKKIADLEKRKANLRNSLENFIPKMPQKSGKKITIDDLDSLASKYINAQAELPDKLDKSSGRGNAKIAAYLGAGHRLQDAVTAAQQDPDSEVAQYIEQNKDWFEAPLQVFEEWKSQNKKYIAQLRKAYSDRFAEIDNEILEEKENKKQYYVKATVPNEPENVGAITKSTKDTLVKEQRALSTDLSVMFQKLIPTIEEGGAEAGVAIQKAMVEIFDRLKKAGIDASLESQIPIEEGNPLLNDDGREALGLRNARAQNYNTIAQSISEDYNRIQNMTAEEIAADMGQTVIDIANTILTTLQQNNLSMGVDNGIYKAVEDEINSAQVEIDKLEESVDPIKQKIAAQEKAIQTVNKALTPLSPSADAKTAEGFLRYSVNQYETYMANPNDERFAASTGKYGANVREQLMVRIKQALDDALKQGVSQESLKDLNLDQFDFEAAQQVLIEERAAAEQQIQLLKEENENNLKMLKEKETALTLAKQRKDMVVRERAASVEEQAASSSNEENNVPKRPRGRPRKNPLPTEAAGGVAAGESVIREEGEKIVAAINQNTDKVISLLGGKNLLQQLEMASPATKDFSTANKDAAEAQLKQIYSELKAYRMSRSRGKFDPLYRESKTVAYQKAYDEAKRQGVSQEVLNAYKLNVTKKDYTSSLATLQNAQDTSILQTLNTLGVAVKQLADGMQADNSDDVSRLLEAINSITEQMRVCCDNMSVMQDIKPALEPISQISNTLGEILAKVSALGGGEGTSAVDAQKEALKQNLKSYFNEVSKINQKRQPNGAINNQETGSNVYANGKVSMFYGEGRSVPGTYKLIDLLSNLESPSVMNIHSHPFSDQRNRIYERTGELWANNTFSLQDIRAAVSLKQNGVPLMGEVNGNLLRLMDISQLTITQIHQIAANYDAARQELLKTHPRYFTEDQDTGEFQLVNTPDPMGHINASQLLDAALADSIQKIGVSPKSIFKTLDITSEAGIDKLVDLIIEAGNTVNTALTPFERASQYLMGRNISYASIERMQNGAMTPLEIVKANLTTNMPESKTFDIANENPIQNLLTSISSTLQSIHQSLSSIQTVIASPQNINREFINNANKNLDIYKYVSPNLTADDHTDYSKDVLQDISSRLLVDMYGASHDAMDSFKVNQNGIITDETAVLIERFLDAQKAYLGSLQDQMRNVTYDGKIQDRSTYDDALEAFNITRGATESTDGIKHFIFLQDEYKKYLASQGNGVSVDNNPSAIHQTLSSILTTLQNIERAINSDTRTWDALTGEAMSYTTRDGVVKSAKNPSTIGSMSQSIADEVRRVEQRLHAEESPVGVYKHHWKVDPNDEQSTGIYMPNSSGDGHTPPPVTNDIYQLLSSKPYATEATLSKVLTKLESGIATNNKAGSTKTTGQAQQNSQKGVSLSAVRGTFNRADTIDTRMQRLLAGDSSLKNTDEYAAYEKAKSAMQSKKGKYLDPTDSPQAAASRLNYATQYLSTMEQTADALQKVAKRQQALNNLASDPRSTIIPETTVVNAQNMEQELMKAAKITDAVGAKFTLGEKFGEATYEIKDATNHLNKMAIAYDKVNKRFIITQKSSKAIDPNASTSSGSSDRDDYGIKSAYMSRFKANAKLNASLNGVPEIKNTQAYKDYMDAYNQMLARKNDFFNYSNKTEAEKQELLNIALAAEETQKDLEKLVKTQREFNDIKARGTTMQGTAGLSGAALNTELQNLAKITDAQQANFKMAKDNGQTIKTATYEVKDHTNQVHEMQMAYNSLTGEVVITETRVTQSLSRMQTVMGSLQKKLKQVLTYIASYGSIYQIFNIIRQGVTYVKEIDSALTELKKVTNATDAEYEQFLNHMSETSAVVGSTVKDLTMMSADWARLGYSMEEAGELARSTAVLLNVSEFTDANSATEALISTIQAFGYAADDSMTVVDKLNEVGNNFAVSSDGLATALQTSASSLMAGGNDLNQAVAMIAAGNKVVQDPSVMGAALRTISLRIRGTKTELEELGEDTEGMVTTTSKLQDKIKGLTGVDILDDTGAYKDTYTILVEIGKVWDNLTDQKKAAALELLAGKNRSNALAAILTNVEDLEAAYESALQAEGSANRELETYLNSIQGKLDKFHNAVQTMWNDLISSDFIKFIVSAGTALVNFIDKIGILGTALTALAGVQVVKNFSSITSVLKTLYSQSFATGQSMLALGLAQLKTSLQTRLLNSAFVQSAVKMKIFTQAELESMTVTQLLQAGLKGLWARLQEIGAGLKTFMALNPWMWAVLGAAAAAAALIYFSNSTKRAKESLQDAQDTLSETSSELRELRGELEDTQDRIKELQSMDKLSFTDQEELKNLKRQNNELQRRIDLLQLQEEQEKKIAADKFVDYMDNAASEKTQYDHSGEKPSFLKKWLDSMGGGMDAYATEDENIDTQLAKYQEYQQEIADLERQIINDKKQGLDTSKDEEQLEDLRAKVKEVSEYMTGKFTEWGESSKGIDYGISDEADKWLDYINNIQDKWAILSGGQNAVSNALTRIFDKDAFAGVSDQIREFADALPDTADEGQELEEYISDLLDKFPKLRETLEELNIPLKDVADYFLYAGDAASESSSEIDNFDKIVQGLNGLKDAYGTLKTAITEYNSQGFMSLDALTALLDLSPEYLALLQMENGQLALNKEAMMAMVQAKLAEAEATVVQNAITQIASLSNKAEAQSTTWVKESAMDAIPALGAYSDTISIVGQNAIVSAGQVDAFMAAIRGAKAAGVDTSAINDVISGMDAQIAALHSLGDNLSGSFNTIMSSGSSGGGGSSDTLLDWLEHYYDTLENKLAELNAQLESKIDDTTVIKSKNTIIDKIIDLYDEKMQKLTNAEATYTARAEKLFKSFSKDIQNKIKNGSLDIQKISDSDLSSDISNYYKYIKAASEARVEMEELQQSIADASKKKFDNITTGYENELGLSQAKIDSFEKQIDLLEERGEQVGTALYSAMMDEQKTRLKSLNKERNELQKVLDNEVKLGHVKVNSDTWYEMVGVINDLDEAIVDTQISIEGYQNSINELKWDAFDELIEKLDRINSQLEFLFERFTDNDEAFDDDGSWTSKGIAALGMLAQQMQLAKNNADKYRKALQQLEQDYKKHLFSEEKYLEKKAVYEEALRDEVESYEDIKDAIVDLNKERIDAVENALSDELDMYKKLVDKKKELLDAEKDLYNFQKGINAKQKNITLLEKQIAALTGSSSAEDITRRIKLQAELDAARQELDDEYYEHSMELTSESLDNEVKYREDQLDRMARDYDKWLKDREQVINTSLNLVKDNAGIVLEQIDLVAEEYGITIAEEIRKPWEAGANAIETYRNKFTDEEMTGAIDEFKKMLDGVSSKWEETSNAAEEASKAAIAAIKKQKDETIKAQNEMLKNYEATIGSMSNVSTVTGGDSVPTYTSRGTSTKSTTTTSKPVNTSGLQVIGTSEIGKVQYKTIENGVGAQIATINGVNYLHHQYKDSKGNVISRYYKLSDLTRETDRNHKVYYSSLGKKINVYRKYAKGTLGTPQSAMALIDELGEELVLNAGPNGRLQYLTKGTSVIPADITKKLMDLALDPTEVLERSRPHANANMSVASNIELNLNIAEVVHVDHADADMIPDLANVVKTQMDKYMKGVNNNLKKYVR